jgi:hypothetical protein
VFKKDGNRVEDPVEVNYEMVSYFKKLLGVNSNFVELNEERLNAAISERLDVTSTEDWLTEEGE